MVRKRPSRSTSARPIGSTSSSAWRFDDCASEPALVGRRTAGRCRRPLSPSGSAGTCTARSGRAASPSATSRICSSSPISTSSVKRAPGMAWSGPSARSSEQAVGGEHAALRHRPPRPAPRPSPSRSPTRPCDALDGARQRIGRRRLRESATAADRRARRPARPSTGIGPALVAIPATQPAPSRHAIVWPARSPCARIVVARRATAAARSPPNRSR